MSGSRLSLTLLGAVVALLVFATGAGAREADAGQTDPCAAFGTSPGGEAEEFEAEDFEDPTTINNRFLPMTPGTRYVLEGRANRGGGPLPHTVTFTVTDLQKKINGVRTLVVWDVDENEGQLVEEELAFFAQDEDGNVWNLGEYPEEFENGEFVGAPNTWIAGLEDATAGIHMLGKPRLGASYTQGFAPAIDFLDCATVFAKGQRVCVPFSCFGGVLVTHETSPLDPAGGIQTKFHAPGVGIVQVGAIDDPEGETLVMTERRALSPDELVEARIRALRLDWRGRRSHELYSQTHRAYRIRPK
jgi:hypothetical protein